ERYATYIFLIVFLVFTIAVLAGGHIPAGAWALSKFSLPDFILGITIAATWQITYAPYVSDYSRYLPKSVGVSATFRATYLGTVISSVWMMGLG
ncbi:cytosine/purines/uracil/thiamine/allantoin permease family protein, partial [mine drainage metagenome]